MTPFSQFLAELRRRKVVRTALIYGALAWAAIEGITTIGPVLGVEPWLVRALVLLVLLGLPVAVVLSWVFDFTPAGVRLEDQAAGEVVAGADPDPAATDEAALSVPPPTPSTPLVGRDEEVDEVADLLASGARVVTLVGPGGTGKTRVAIAVARRLWEGYEGQVAFIPLAAVTDPDEVVPTVASALGVTEAENRSLADGLVMVVGDRPLLLVLDNLEQVVEAAQDIASLLARCPALQVLATSRAPLRITSETEYPLRPLAFPSADAVSAPEDLREYPSVELFLDRAGRARPDFELRADNAAAVAEICRRLDGLPLALELAAARLRVLEPAALAERLDSALDVLTAGTRDLPRRQQTLRATIDWSHSLLEEGEQRLFRSLAVFAGGFTHEAVEAVAYDDPGAGALDELQSLLEKGLVQRADDDRFVLLETIREYARERLEASGDKDRLRKRHAEYFLALAERIDRGFRGPEQLEAVAMGDRDRQNLDAALSFFQDRARNGDEHAVRDGLHLCGHLWFYWHVRGLHLRARELSRDFLDSPAGAERTLARARALRTVGLASWTLGDFPASLDEFGESLRIMEEVSDGPDVARASFTLGFSYLTAGEIEPARTHLERSVQIARELGPGWELGMALTLNGMSKAAVGDVEGASRDLEEGLALQKRNGDREGAGLALSGLAALEAGADRHARALELYRDSRASFKAVGDRPEEARILDAMGWSALALERADDARAWFADSLRAYQDVGSVRGIGLALLGLAATEVVEGNPRRALRMAAAAEVFSEQEGVANIYGEGSPAEAYLQRAREAVPEDELSHLDAEGRALSVHEVVGLALHPRPDRLTSVAR